MSIHDVERASVPGILDSDAVSTDRPVSAKVLREIARTANFLRDAPAEILSTGWRKEDEVWYSALIEPQTIALWHGCPLRPAHTIGQVRLRATLDTGSSARFKLATPSHEVDLALTTPGAINLYTGNLELPGSTDVTSTQLALTVEHLGGATATGIGTPVSWDAATTTTVINSNRVGVATSAWLASALRPGLFLLQITETSTGIIVANKRVQYSVGQELFLDPWTQTEFNAVEDLGTGYSCEIQNLARYTLDSLHILGAP